MSTDSKIASIFKKYSNTDLLIIDVGAKGSVEHITALAPATNMYAFEPNPAEYEKLIGSYTNNIFKSLQIYKEALGNTRGTMEFHITRHAAMSSLLRPDPVNYSKHFGTYKEYTKWENNIEVTERIPVNVNTIDNLFYNRTDQIDYLKLDTQGNELDILHGAAQVLKNKKISVLKIEVSTIPVYHHQAVFSEIDVFLRAHGYVLVDLKIYRDNSKLTNADEHYAPCGDAIYVLNEPADNTSHFKTGVILFWLGYSSLANHYFSQSGIETDDLTIIKKVRRIGFKGSIKLLATNLVPPVLMRFLKAGYKLLIK